MGPVTLFILFLTISHVSILQINSVIAANPKGFSLKIIHSDSKESPLYPGDHLTPEERLQRLVQQSKDRARYIGLQVSSFNTTTNSINPDAASIPVSYEGTAAFYIAEVGLGTFVPPDKEPIKKRYLIVDTGSEMVWTQCAGASYKAKYFFQKEELYPAGNSITYQPLFCKDHHPLCIPGKCEQGVCTYTSSFSPTAISMGVLAKEKFTVSDGTFDIIMGCGFYQKGFEQFLGKGKRAGKPDLVTGVLGLGSGPRSLPSQLNISTFSYCLKTSASGAAPTVSSTYLRFGSDATIGGGLLGAPKTPLVAPPTGRGPYLLNLEGISLNGIRIPYFFKSDFEYDRRTGNGGFFIDSATPYTILHKPIYLKLLPMIILHFTEQKLPLLPGLKFGVFTTCFSKVAVDIKDPIPLEIDYPKMTFHFEGGANFELDKPETLFSIGDLTFCIGMVPVDTNINILGTMQQADKTMLYDTSEMKLSFAEADC